MMSSTWFVLLALTAAYLISFAQISRNPVLRLVAASPDQPTVDKSYMPHLIVVGLVPVLVFFASNFPSLGQMLVSWLDPVLKAFK